MDWRAHEAAVAWAWRKRQQNERMEKPTFGFVTKDSGQRTQFDSGMVRDTTEGKLRVDLGMDGPLFRALYRGYPAVEAFLDWYEHPTLDNAVTVILCIANEEGIALADFFERYVQLMERGAAKYTERNWMQANGLPEMNRFQQSAARHFWQWFKGQRDEDHATAVWFNMNGYHYVEAKLQLKGAA